MYTVVIFWQKREFNENIDFFLERNMEEISVLTMDNNKKQDIEEFRDEILSRVNEREQWRLFLVDNYIYQCVAHDKRQESDGCCCCNPGCSNKNCHAARWRRKDCGMGQNPFIASDKIREEKNVKHRKELLRLLDGILDVSHTKFQQPKELFVIAVRDGGFPCKQEISIPNFRNEYWKVAEEFPAFCRYFVYDINEVGKELFEREKYWFYCLILLLGKNELYMEQFLPRCMYRIDVEYSIVEYYKYLDVYKKELEEKLIFWEKKKIECENDGNIKEQAISSYPITFSSQKSRWKQILDVSPNDENWEKKKQETLNRVWEIYHTVPKEYEEQWDKIRKEISQDGGENAYIYEKEKELYEQQLWSVSYRKEAETVELIEMERDASKIEDDFKKSLGAYEDSVRNGLNIGNRILCVFALFVSTGIFFSCIQHKFPGGMDIIVSVMGIVIISTIVPWMEEQRKKDKLNNILAEIDNQQLRQNERRIDFFEKTKIVMIYWKRIGNLNKYKKDIEKRKKEISEKETVCQKQINKMKILWDMGEEEAYQAVRRIRKKEKKRKIFIASREVETEFSFIERVRFHKIEKRRGRNT